MQVSLERELMVALSSFAEGRVARCIFLERARLSLSRPEKLRLKGASPGFRRRPFVIARRAFLSHVCRVAQKSSGILGSQ